MTKYHANNPAKCLDVSRGEIPSFKHIDALGSFTITAVDKASKAAGETYDRLETCRRFIGKDLAQYAAGNGCRNWLGYFADRGKVTITRGLTADDPMVMAAILGC